MAVSFARAALCGAALLLLACVATAQDGKFALCNLPEASLHARSAERGRGGDVRGGGLRAGDSCRRSAAPPALTTRTAGR
jgi:hypothetical protein